MGPDPQGPLAHQHRLQNLGVQYAHSLALHGPLWDLDSQWDHVGLAHNSPMMSLEVHQGQETPQHLDAQEAQVGLGDQYLQGIL